MDNYVRSQCRKCGAMFKSSAMPSKCVCGSQDIFALSATSEILLKDMTPSAQYSFKHLHPELLNSKPLKSPEADKAIKIFFDKKDLAKKFINIQPVYYDEGRLWWLWDFKDKCWKLNDETDIMNFISNHSEANTVNSKERSEIVEALRQEARKNKPRQVEPTWIQFQDTIFDIKTGKEFEATPDYFVVNPIPYALDKNRFMETPAMDALFEQWVGKENVRALYEIMAYSLLPDYPLHRLFCLIGAGMNGKSCFIRMLKKFIGQNNCCSTELDCLLNSRFEVTRLHKKLICIMGETNFNEMSRTSILKKLTGGDLIGFEYKNKNPFEDTNYAKIIIATNNLPTTTDKTIGFYRRWFIIDFPNQFSEEKDILSTIPEEEYECLALKCATLILPDLLEKRRFTNEGSVEDRMEKYEAKSNFLDKFLKEHTTNEDVNGYITKADFYKQFSAWCRENRHRDMSETSVGIAMKKGGIEAGAKYFDWLHDGRGGLSKIWTGIKWR